MHIPDGLMSPEFVALGWIVALAVITLSVARMNRRVDDRVIPFMAILAAGIFVAQMINFPVWGGTTGHLVGAALATVLLGPYAAVIVISVILIIQCFVFGDGGLTALGLNIMNMAVVGCFVSWGAFRLFSPKHERNGAIVAAWASVFVAALVTALELALSYDLSGGTYGIIGTLSIPLMLGYHALIGVGEAMITGGIFIYLAKVAPEILKMRVATKEAPS